MSATPDELKSFVHDALARNLPRAQIEAALREAGWPQEHIRQALGAFAEVDFPVPVPRPQPYLSAREAFFYLVLFSTLFLFVFHLGSVLFELINGLYPDPVGRDISLVSMRWSLAYVIISFPVFLFLAIRQERELRASPEKRASRVRKWLTYLTLFIAAGFVIGDLVTLVRYLLEGELSARFLCKVGVVALLAGTAFAYYLRDLRKDEQ